MCARVFVRMCVGCFKTRKFKILRQPEANLRNGFAAIWSETESDQILSRQFGWCSCIKSTEGQLQKERIDFLVYQAKSSRISFGIRDIHVIRISFDCFFVQAALPNRVHATFLGMSSCYTREENISST